MYRLAKAVERCYTQPQCWFQGIHLLPPPFFDLESLTPYVETVVNWMLGQQDRQSSLFNKAPFLHCPLGKLAGQLGYLLALMPNVRKLAPSVESCGTATPSPPQTSNSKLSGITN
jgi:hypothetical protein